METAEKLITENLDVWTSAVKAKSSVGRGSSNTLELYGIKKTRELILEMAVRGMLVPQSADDEPASALLKSIGQERARLTKEGLIKTPRRLPALTAKELRHELPPTWEWVRFGEIASHNAGKTLDRGRNTGELRKYLTTSNLYWGRFDLTNVREMPIREDELAKCTAQKNDLLICEGGEAGRAAVWDSEDEICIQNHVHRARLYGGISPYYAYRFLEALSANGDIDQYRKGVGISNMSGKALSSIPLPLPPLAEQHRIVAKVDELMALCDQLEQEQTSSLEAHATLVATLLCALTNATASAEGFADAWQRIQTNFDTLFTTESSIDQLKQTILQLAVMGKLVPQDPKDEPTARLTVGDHVDFKNGYAFKSGWFKDSGVRLCRNMNVSHDNLDWSDSKYVDDDVASEFEQFSLSEGDIVLSLDRPLINTGLKVARISKSDLPCLLLQRVAKPVPKHDNLDLGYFYMWLHSPAFVDSIDPGRSNGVPHISTKQVSALPLNLPPLAEQHRIVAKVDELMAICDQLKASLATAQATQLNLADSLVEQAIE